MALQIFSLQKQSWIATEKPSKEEIRIAIKLLKDGKDTGPDGTQQKLLKLI